MQESGGRRIKRSVLIDANSIHFLTPEEQGYLRKAQLLEPYLAEKEQELNAYNQMSQLDLACRINGRRLTNIGSFSCLSRTLLA